MDVSMLVLFSFSRTRGEGEECRIQHNDLEPRIIVWWSMDVRVLFREVQEQSESSGCRRSSLCCGMVRNLLY